MTDDGEPRLHRFWLQFSIAPGTLIGFRPGRGLGTRRQLRSADRNAFEIGRDYQRDLDRDTVQPLTSRIRSRG